MYVASIIYCYFLRSASLRHHLEWSPILKNQERFGRKSSIKFHERCLHGFKNLLFSGLDKQPAHKSKGVSPQATKQEDLRCFVMGFDSESFQRCAKFKSKEGRSVMENQTQALFGIDRVNELAGEEVILTSFSSLKRLALEAVAFGSFLWDAEERVDSVYKLSENLGRTFSRPKMVFFLIFTAVLAVLTTLTSLFVRAILSTAAHVLVSLIQLSKLQRETLDGATEQFSEAIRAVFQFVFEFLLEIIFSVFSTILEHVKNIAVEAASVSFSLAGDLMEKTKSSFEELSESLPENLSGLHEFLVSTVSDFVNNIIQAAGYVSDNA